MLYELGDGVPADQGQAMQWRLRAAEGGQVDSLNRIGLMYLLGRGTPRNPSTAAYWFRKAAQRGDADAQEPQADRILERLEPQLTASQRAEAGKLFEEWRGAHPAPAE